MADYNVNMKQWNGSSFDNVLPLAFNSKALEGKSYDDIIQYVQSLLGIDKGKNALVAWGSYIGTGLSGQNHPNSVECVFCPAALVLFSADGRQTTTVIRGVTACSSGVGAMYNYYTWGDTSVSWVSKTLQSDSDGYMASSQFNSSGKEYCYLVLGYDAD